MSLNFFDTQVNRRNLLRNVSTVPLSIALGSVTMSASAVDEPKNRTRKVIQWVFDGGLSQEVWDPKPESPLEVRGNIDAIQTSIPGEKFSSLSPHLAAIADKLTIVRTIQSPSQFHDRSTHALLWNKDDFYLSGHGRDARTSAPLAYLESNFAGKDLGLTGEVNKTRYMNDTEHAALDRLDASWNGERIVLADLQTDVLQLKSRMQLLDNLDLAQLDGPLARQIQANRKLAASVLSHNGCIGKKVNRETLELYGDNQLGHIAIAALELARSGFGAVDIRCGHWDFHERIEEIMSLRFPHADKAIAAQISDIQRNSESEDIVVAVTTEFGRTPIINEKAGRDHWTDAHSELFYGGTFPQGRVVGETTNNWEIAADPLQISSIKDFIATASGNRDIASRNPDVQKVFE